VVSFFVVSVLEVSTPPFLAVSVAVFVLAESFIAVLSLLLADFVELQPVANEPIIAATMAKLKMCFEFITYKQLHCLCIIGIYITEHTQILNLHQSNANILAT
jgi:hypothetical protein